MGCFTNYNDPEGEGLAILDVLEHNGIKVIMPKFKCCGIAKISAGAQDMVMDDIRHNLKLLNEYTKKNIPILLANLPVLWL